MQRTSHPYHEMSKLRHTSLFRGNRIAYLTQGQQGFVILIGLVGSVLAMFIPIAGAVLLLVAGIAFFYIAGWWALLASPFFLVGAVLAYNVSRVKQK